MSIESVVMQSRIKLKDMASRWAERFQNALKVPTLELEGRLEVVALAPMLDDSKPITSAMENKVSGNVDLYKRFKTFDIPLTEKALAYLSLMVESADTIAMLVAFMAQMRSDGRVMPERVMTCYWLVKHVFQGRVPTRDVYSKMWGEQKTVDAPRGNLVDLKFAFEAYTEQESRYKPKKAA